MIKFCNISNWQEKPHFQTGGTRNKVIVENPDDGNLYYFKTSLKRANDEYKYEFWSEIIASAIGKELEFNTLHYNIAFNKNEIGCLSKSMINANENNLSEIINYLQGYDSNYNPKDKDSYSKYTFQFIEDALNEYRLKDKMSHIITTIIFDSLIGNSDRHQENWGFIIPNMHGIDGEKEKRKNNIIDSNKFKVRLNPFIKKKEIAEFVIETTKGVFAPIYDSGSCLGRELLDEKVDKLLNDNQMLCAYIKRGCCEVRWDNDKKISHFDLIKRIMEQVNYKAIVENEIKRIDKVFDIEKIEKIINNVDISLPEHLNQHKLPENRKRLMKKIISLRFSELKGVLV
jgi:hypothetical protein